MICLLARVRRGRRLFNATLLLALFQEVPDSGSRFRKWRLSVRGPEVAEEESVPPQRTPNAAERAEAARLLRKLAHRQLGPNDWRKLARHWKFTDDQVRAIEHQYTGRSATRPRAAQPTDPLTTRAVYSTIKDQGLKRKSKKYRKCC